MFKYPSRYSPGKYITPAQYITEIICEKHAYQQQKELPLQFWKIKKWARYYRFQITLANQLLEKFPANDIISALRCKEAERIFSLKNPYLRQLIKKQK